MLENVFRQQYHVHAGESNVWLFQNCKGYVKENILWFQWMLME